MPSKLIINELVGAIKDKNIEKIRNIFDSNELNGAKPATAGMYLHAAIQTGFIPSINFLLEQEPSLMISNQKGQTPLTLAVFMNLPDVLEILIQKGADVNATGKATSNLKSVKNYSPVHAAAETGNLALLTRLVNAGADVNKVRETSTRNSMPMVHGRGTSVSYSNVEKETALDLANKSQHEDVINYLLAAGAISAKSVDKDEPNNFCSIM